VISSGSAPADVFDNPLSEKEEAKDLVSDWELSQSIAVDLVCLQVGMYVGKRSSQRLGIIAVECC
jgi:hypothetical protein